MNTLDEKYKIDCEEQQMRMLHSKLVHLLHDKIAPANMRSFEHDLWRFLTESDVTLIHKNQLRLYQELERLSLNVYIKN